MYRHISQIAFKALVGTGEIAVAILEIVKERTLVHIRLRDRLPRALDLAIAEGHHHAELLRQQNRRATGVPAVRRPLEQIGSAPGLNGQLHLLNPNRPARIPIDRTILQFSHPAEP
ncbi:MAG: hypothetical protein ACOX52_17710 [Verrucomicrobiota bacterium]